MRVPVRVRTGAVLAFLGLGVVAVLGLASCGGGSTSKDATSTTGAASPAATASGSDAAFVKELCSAGKTFADSVTAVLKEPNALSDPAGLVSKLATPYDAFAKAFAAAKAPADLAQWQSDTSKSLNESVAKVKGGQGLNNLLSGGSELVPSLPASASARLSPLVASNADCKAAGLTFGTHGS